MAMDGESTPRSLRSRSRSRRRRSKGNCLKEKEKEKEVTLKVRTSTGKILRLVTGQRTCMNEVMEKVMMKWTLATGESCLGIVGDEGVLPLPWDATVQDIQGSGSHLVLSGAFVYPACESEAELTIKTTASQGQLKGLKVRLKKGRVIRLKDVTTDSTVEEVIESIRAHEEKHGEPTSCDHILFFKGRPLTSFAATLADYNISLKDVVTYTAQPESTTPPLLQYKAPTPTLPRNSSYDRRGSNPPTSLPVITSSPLCQFTLCSLSPIFGPVLPPSLSLPAC